MPVKAKCPGCRAVLTIDRPDEPRTAPCPRCQHLIRVPEDLTKSPATVAAAEPVSRREAETVLTQQRSSSVPMFLGVGALLLGATAFFQPDLAADGIQNSTEPAPASYNKEAVLDELAEFESLETELKSRVDDLQHEIEAAKLRLESQLKTTREVIDQIPSTIKVGA